MLVGLLATAAILGVCVGSARAAVALAVDPKLPGSVTVGETGVSESFIVSNVSSGAEAGNAVTLDQIVLTLSCGTQALLPGGCPPASADPGVLAAVAAAGGADTACAGTTFAIGVDPQPDTYRLMPSRPVILASDHSCEIDLTIDVLQLPTLDAAPSLPGVQTEQRVRASASAGDSIGGGEGRAPLTITPGNVPIATQVVPADLALGGAFRDTATLTSSGGAVPPTGTVTFQAFRPGDTTCSGPPTFSSTAVIPGTNRPPGSSSAPTSTSTTSTGTTPTSAPAASTASLGLRPAAGSAIVTRANSPALVTSVASDTFHPTVAGTYRVTATYSGDANYRQSASSCSDPTERETVADAPVAPPSPSPGPSHVVVSITSPVDGAHYPRGASIAALYACTVLPLNKHLERCSGPVPSGVPIDTRTPGSQAFRVEARGVGGDASATVTYVVDAAIGPRTPPGPPLASPGANTPPGSQDPGRRPGVTPPTLPGRQPADRAPAYRPAVLRSNPSPDAASVIAIEVAAFTLLSLAGGRGLALAGRDVARGAWGPRTVSGAEAGLGGPPREGETDREAAEVAYLAARDGLGAGDRSRTWRWPGTRRLDIASLALPARLSARSPLLARVVDDSAYLRSMFGSLAVSTQVAGVTLGGLAVSQTGSSALPPGTGLTIAIAVLGVIDATAGFVAVLTFATASLALGGLDSTAGLRILLGLAALWFVVPVLAGATRPLRRDPPTSAQQRFDRAADFVIVSLIGAWAVQKVVLALPILAGQPLRISSHADEIALCVLGALIVRLFGETIAARHYPRRLIAVEPQGLHEPGAPVRLAAAALRTALFAFFATVVVRSSWQLFAGILLVLAPQVLAVYAARLPKYQMLRRTVPNGLLRTVLLLFVLTAGATILLSTHSKALLADSFVILAAPGAILTTLHQFIPSRHRTSLGWGRRLGGLAIVSAGVLQVLGFLV